MRRVEEAGQAGQPRDLGEDRQQILGVAVLGPSAEPVALAELRDLQPLAGAGDDGAVEQAVVLQKTEEDEGEDPVHRRLVHRGAEEGLEGVGGALRSSRASRHSASTAARPAEAA